MRAFFYDFSILQKENAMAEPGGGQPVGDEQRGLPRRHVLVLLIDVVFRQRVEGGGGFVQQQDRAVLVQRPRQHQPLGLAAGEQHAV